LQPSNTSHVQVALDSPRNVSIIRINGGNDDNQRICGYHDDISIF